MPSAGFAIGDGIFDATMKSLKTGHGLGFFGNLGAGVVKGVGGLALGTAELTGKAAMGGAGAIGKGLVDSFKGNPYAVLGAVATGAAIGHIGADLDGQADTRKAMQKGALFATGAAAIGGAGFISGLGIAGAGAAVMGANALGTVGSHFLKPKTQGEKYTEVEKSFKRKDDWTDAQYKEKFANEVKRVGAKEGSAEEMEIGLGNMNDFKLRKGFAVPMIVGSSLIKGIAGGVHAFEKSRMGMNDGMVRNATPRVPVQQTTGSSYGGGSSGHSYSNNAGATGDLVFALHNNR